MIQVTNTATQAVAVGAPLTFSKITLRSCGACECFNSQVPTSIKLCGKGTYEIHFSANITSDAAATPIQLALAVAGNALVETAMNAVPAAAGDLVNVHTSTLFKNCCGDLDRISVINTGANALTVAQNPNLYIVKVSNEC